MQWSSLGIGVSSLVIGWFLSEFAKSLQINRERRAHIGRALSNLMELYHQVQVIENSIQFLKQHTDLRVEDEAAMRKMMNQILPAGEEYIKKYTEAIEQLSETKPLEAFYLRTRAQIPKFLNFLQSISDGGNFAEYSLVEKNVREGLMPSLKEAIIELSKYHGSSTRNEVERYLSSPYRMPDEINRILESVSRTT